MKEGVGEGWVRGGAPAALHFSIQYAVKREEKNQKSWKLNLSCPKSPRVDKKKGGGGSRQKEQKLLGRCWNNFYGCGCKG